MGIYSVMKCFSPNVLTYYPREFYYSNNDKNILRVKFDLQLFFQIWNFLCFIKNNQERNESALLHHLTNTKFTRYIGNS